MSTIPSNRTRSVLRGVGIVLIITLLARIAGFVRYLVFGASVGAGDVGTAYASANLLPTVLFEIVAGGALAAAVVPLVAGLVPERPAERDKDAEHLEEDVTRDGATPAQVEPVAASTQASEQVQDAAAADRIISALLTWTLLITVPLGALVAVFAQPLSALLLGTDNTGVAVVTLGASLLRIFAVQLPLYGIAVVLGAYLQARRRFAWPALMPLLSSLVVMISYRVYAAIVPPVATAATIPRSALAWLGWGTTAGVLAMALPVLIVSLRCGLRLRPTLRMPEGYGARARALAGAGLGAVLAQQAVMGLILLVSMRAGGTGTLPVFQYAQALYLLPYAILVVPLMTSVFPHLSELRLVGDTIAFARMATGSVRAVIVVSVIGSSALFAAGPALEQFFRLIDRAGAVGVGATSAALAMGLAGYAVMMQCSRVLSAALRARDALVVGSVGWIVAGVLVLIVAISGRERGAAVAATGFGLAIAIGMGVGALIGLARVHELIELAEATRSLRRTALSGPFALVLGAIPGLLLTRLLVTTSTGEVGAVLAGIAGGASAGVISLLIMALADPEQVRRLLRRLPIGRRRTTAPAPTPATAETAAPTQTQAEPHQSGGAA